MKNYIFIGIIAFSAAMPLIAMAAPVQVIAGEFQAVLNQDVSIPVYVSSGTAGLSNAIVDIEIYDANNAKVLQRYFERQNFSGTETKEYSVSWKPQREGSYSIRAGIFGENWSSLYLWNHNVKTFSVSAISVAEPTVSVISSASIQRVATLEVWWPTNGARLTGNQPLKGLVKDRDVNSYDMYWQVDGDRLNVMPTNYSGTPHKEVLVNFDGWNWKGSGPYTLNFIARSGGTILAEKKVNIYVGSETSVAVAPSVPGGGNPFSGQRLYVNLNSQPKQWADSHRYSWPYGSNMMDKIARQPEIQWFGNWNWNLFQDVRNRVSAESEQGAIPVMVAYNIPQRDCGGYSAGGTGSPDAYRSWIRTMADAIGNRKAVVLLEPDATSLIDCLSVNDKEIRFSLLRDAVDVFNAKGISVYIDAGHPGWISANEMAGRLKKAGIDRAQGFSLNISNFATDQNNINYGQQLSELVGGKHFVVETSRNGLGPTPDNQWCNPQGRALGRPPTTDTGYNLIDAYLWVRGPAGSDGYCNGGPAAGSFWPEYGIGLAERAAW